MPILSACRTNAVVRCRRPQFPTLEIDGHLVMTRLARALRTTVYFHKSLILKGNSCIMEAITNLSRRPKMKRKNGTVKRAKIRKNRATDGGHATLRAFRLLHSLKNALRVACPPGTVNLYSIC